jgi:hypothetical protein
MAHSFFAHTGPLLMHHHVRDRACLAGLRVSEDGHPIYAVRWDEPQDQTGLRLHILAEQDTHTSADGYAVSCLWCLLESHPEPVLSWTRRGARGHPRCGLRLLTPASQRERGPRAAAVDRPPQS